MRSAIRLFCLSLLLAPAMSHAATTATAPFVLPLSFNGAGPTVSYSSTGASFSVAEGESLLMLVNSAVVSMKGKVGGTISLTSDGVPSIDVTSIGYGDGAGVQFSSPTNTPLQIRQGYYLAGPTFDKGMTATFSGGRGVFGLKYVGSVDQSVTIANTSRSGGTVTGGRDGWGTTYSTDSAKQTFESALPDYSNATPFVHRKLATATTSGRSGHAAVSTSETSLRWFAGGTNIDAAVGGSVPGSTSGTSGSTGPTLKVTVGINN